MRISLKQKLSIGAGSIFGLLIIFYAIFQLHDVIFGVTFELRGITDGGVYTDSKLMVEGSVHKATSLLINDNQVALAKDGTFTDELLLTPGYSIMTVRVKDKFGREETQTYRVYYLSQQAAITNSDTVSVLRDMS